MTRPTDQRSVLFVFEIEVGLYEDEIWPDGDAPENWTIDDVADLVKECGGANRVLRDWDLNAMMTLRLFGDGGEATCV